MMTYNWDSIENRPYYTDFAFAYDQLIIRPIKERCQFLDSYIIEHKFDKNSRILDAGCGTGGYTVELAKLGYRLTGVDLSSDQINMAQQKAAAENQNILFIQDNLLNHKPDELYNIILCRGVLNDILDDDTRQNIFNHFYSLLASGGLLIVDVRDWESSKNQIRNKPMSLKKIDTKKGVLEVKSSMTLNESNQSYDIVEQYNLANQVQSKQKEYHLTMRCWSQKSLNHTFESAGFKNMNYRGDFKPDCPVGATVYIIGFGYKE